MSGRLAGKAALVTGSTTGIGEAIARRFAAEGALVMVHGRREAEAQGVVEAIRAGGGVAEYHLCDLADPEACKALVDVTRVRLGRLDILINNAAFIIRSDIDTTDAALFDRTMAINVRAPMLLIQAALPYFDTQRAGAVVNIGSINAYCGERNQLVYSISKGALMTLTRNLADALGRRRIRINHFNVGWVLSKNEYELKMRDGLPADWPTHIPPTYAPSGSILSPEQIAHFALSFVDDAGGFVSGSVLELEQYPIIGRNPEKE